MRLDRLVKNHKLQIGSIIVFADGATAVVGSINMHAGWCDDCNAWDQDVERIIPPPDLVACAHCNGSRRERHERKPPLTGYWTADCSVCGGTGMLPAWFNVLIQHAHP